MLWKQLQFCLIAITLTAACVFGQLDGRDNPTYQDEPVYAKASEQVVYTADQVARRNGYSAWKQAGEAGAILGYRYYMDTQYMRQTVKTTNIDARTEPKICDNNHYPKSERKNGIIKTYIMFICPLSDSPDKGNQCCGEARKQHCCFYYNDIREIVLRYLWAIIAGPILILICCCFCCIKLCRPAWRRETVPCTVDNCCSVRCYAECCRIAFCCDTCCEPNIPSNTYTEPGYKYKLSGPMSVHSSREKLELQEGSALPESFAVTPVTSVTSGGQEVVTADMEAEKVPLDSDHTEPEYATPKKKTKSKKKDKQPVSEPADDVTEEHPPPAPAPPAAEEEYPPEPASFRPIAPAARLTDSPAHGRPSPLLSNQLMTSDSDTSPIKQKKPRPYFYPSNQRVDIHAREDLDRSGSSHNSMPYLDTRSHVTALSMPVVSYHKPHSRPRSLYSGGHNTTSSSGERQSRSQRDVSARDVTHSRSTLGRQRPYNYPNEAYVGEEEPSHDNTRSRSQSRSSRARSHDRSSRSTDRRSRSSEYSRHRSEDRGLSYDRKSDDRKLVSQDKLDYHSARSVQHRPKKTPKY